MEHLGDQTKIHFNPEFFSRGKTPLNPKVHVNPAFLQKSQGTLTAQKYVTPAAPASGSTDHKQCLHGLTSGTSRPPNHMSIDLHRTHTGNTDKHASSQSSKIVKDCTVSNSSIPQGHSLYTENNLYNPYNEIFPRYTKGLPKAQNVVSKRSFAGKNSSTYSWKAYNPNSWVPPNQGTSSTSVKVQGNANLVQHPGYVIQQYTYPNSAVNKSFISTALTRRISASHKVTHHNELTASYSSLHSNSPDINKNVSGLVRGSTKVTRNMNPNLFTYKAKSETKPSKTAAQENSSKVAEYNKTHCLLSVEERISDEVTENRTKNLHISRDKNEIIASKTPAQNARDLLRHVTAPKSELRKSSNASAAYASCSVTAAQPVRFTPNRKWVSKTTLVNASSRKPNQTRPTDPKNNDIHVELKGPEQKGNLKVITKTKLVRTHSNSTNKSKVHQQAPVGVQSAIHSSKTAHFNSTRVTTLTRSQKFSPAARVHQTYTRFNGKKRYSVLSCTKLVRSQSLSGKAATPGKAKYSVNTKNKLVRRRSNSDTASSKSSSKASESKAKANKPETERQKKFHVLSKTKIIRRRSNSGAYKAVSTQGLVPLTHHHKKRGIVKRHKLIRNVSLVSVKHATTKFNRSLPKKVNTAFKVINITPKVSTKQKIAKGIISKYKINHLKSASPNNYKKHKKFFDYSSKSRQESEFRFQNKKMCTSKHSDKFINIGGILYKSTKTSLQKQLPKASYKASMKKKTDSTCTVFLRGEKFNVTAGGRTLQRVKDSTPTKNSLPRVHIGGLTYSRTHTGQYELTKTHQALALLSSARQRSMVTLIQKRRKASYQKRNEYCIFFNRFGRCSKKNKGECPYVHDPSRVAICTRFLRGRCPVNRCPFSHTIDPDKMPVCSHFLQAACSREDCPYRHVKVNPSAPVCLDFVRGHCKAGEECDKQHILVCEEFKNGNCPRGPSCPLSHHKGKKRPRKVSISRDSTRRTSLSIYRKRKKSDSFEILGGPVIKKRVEKRKREVEASSQQRYFNYETAENNLGENSKDVPENGECGDSGVQEVFHAETIVSAPKILNSDINSKVSEAAQGQRDEVQKDQVVHVSNYADGPTGKSFFEETRSRVMKRVDQMKKSHMAFSNEDPTENTMNSLIHSMEYGKSEPSNEIMKKPIKSDDLVTDDSSEVSAQSCSAIDNPVSDSLRVQRPPLPKEMPSYIPLTLDEH